MTTTLKCPPRFATPRGDRETLGPKVAEYARKELGITMMPWQRYVLDVLYELDDKNNFVYGDDLVTVPRQSGKTTLVLPRVCWRMDRFGGRQRAVYTAQDGVSARDKFINDYCHTVSSSPLASRVDPRLANGSEALHWKQNKSIFGIKAPTRKAGHGSTLDMAVADEIFAHEDDRLEQALRPTMRTRRSPQFCFTSTAGDEKSFFLWSKVKAGRLACQLGDHGTIGYFEWSAPSPAELGMEDWEQILEYVGSEETWVQATPALGYTITLDTLRKEWD
jgi:phage terminase large subunit-like protein